ncbi:hypothetical protein EGW08_023571 [Elysia chlorotica]|uniref:Programmed cell death protein 2 C-terminal domain-containing protein n=1 Tax=Elysia chlorotica TaxID=188477 RepID=A0A3S1GYG0_ELYCH|nr:hypothetical protein EGW08_023571 [Elysia chlorotica]
MFVLIGLIDQPIHKQENVGWDTNKVGGYPIWLNTPPASQASCPPCRLCRGPQSLVAQLYCPLGGSAYHRCLYVFACPNRCNLQTQGWQVFRSMQYDPTFDATCSGSNKSTGKDHNNDQHKGDVDVSSWAEDADDWGDGADDWGDAEDNWGGSEADASQTATKDSLVCSDDLVMTIESKSDSDVHPSANDMQHLADNFSAQMNIISNSDASVGSPVANGSNATSTLEAEPDGGVEESMLVVDAGRLDAMAEILNTKHEEKMLAIARDPLIYGDVKFKAYYLEVVEEPVEEEQVSDHVLNLIKDYEKSEGHSLSSLLHERSKTGKGKSGASEGYEKSELRHGDRKFHKFLKRLQRCPQQCVRYNRGGDPLLVDELEDIARCPACGGERVFELQLLPALLPWLQVDGTEHNVEIDFGTVLVFTCKNNCWQDEVAPHSSQLMEEVIVLQGDPDRHLYR